MNRESANDWLEQNKKSPMRYGDGTFRWVKPDVGPDSRPEELPCSVFDSLKSTRERPWLFDTEEEAISAAIQAIVASFVVCPRCKGKGHKVVHLCYGPSKGGERKSVACELCDGISCVSPEINERFEIGQRHWTDRRARKVSVADEAARLGITESELYRREWGLEPIPTK